MGLDGVELIMATEEQFKIAISDADASQCVTVGNLVDLVFSQLRKSEQEACASQRGFYVVRREMMKILGLQRFQIKPDSNLDELIGRENRRENWHKLFTALDGKMRSNQELVRPWWMLLVLRTLIVMIFLCLWLFTWFPVWTDLGISIVAGMIAYRLTATYKTEFTPRFSQVKDLVQLITTLDSGIWTKDEVFQKVKAIVVEQLGVKESQVTMDAHFLNDLGME